VPVNLLLHYLSVMKRGHAGIFVFVFAAVFVFAIIAEVKHWPGATPWKITGQVGLGVALLMFFILPKTNKR
jgi:hypothetical protein